MMSFAFKYDVQVPSLNVHDFLKLQEHKHIVIVQEESPKENSIEFEFIKKGLEEEQVCLYITNNVDSAKMLMEKSGINISQSTEKELLHIVKIPRTFSNYEKVILDIVKDLRKYEKNIRVVSTHDFDFSSNDHVDSMIEIEQKIDNMFSEIPGSMLCSFSLSEINQNQSKILTTKLLDSHQTVMFLQKDGTPKWFNLP